MHLFFQKLIPRRAYLENSNVFRELVSAALLFFILNTATWAQPVLDLTLRKVLSEAHDSASYTRQSQTITPRRNILLLTSDNFTPTATNIKNIAPGVFSARVSNEEFLTLSADTTIRRIISSSRHRLLSDRTRQATLASLVQMGEGLDAPFSGRGVIIGVIDEGFEYQHAAFLDDKGESRVKYVWNRRLEASEPTANIPTGGDGYNYTSGHATHVASIAAGRSVSSSNFYGMAPDAELIFIPSNLDNAELLEDVAFISGIARSEGKPWILNISFGSHDGPHDGKDFYSRTMNKLLEENGGFLVAAMGNEGGEKYHAQATLGNDATPARFLLSPNSTELMLDLWVQTDDSTRHTTLRPFVWKNNTVNYEAIDFSTIFFEEINPDNCKQHALLSLSRSMLYQSGGYLPVGIEVSGEAGTTIHAWTDEGLGVFYQPNSSFVRGDDRFLACEGGASVPAAIAVGAYTAANSTERLNGANVSFTTTYPLDEICYFSNSGPYLGSERKPTTAAPGAIIRAAVSKVAPDFSARASTLVEKRTYAGETYYYGYKSGTSMSTPVVTGILALWLEACPILTHAQVLEILRTTSQTEADTLHWGYGRINAYAGLQAALTYAAQTGIDNTRQSDFPLALQHSLNGWQVLVCRPLTSVRWSLSDLSGRIWANNTISNLSQSQEFHISTCGLPPGIYILRLQADGKECTKKIIKG